MLQSCGHGQNTQQKETWVLTLCGTNLLLLMMLLITHRKITMYDVRVWRSFMPHWVFILLWDLLASTSALWSWLKSQVEILWHRSTGDGYGQAASNLVAGSALEQTVQQIVDMGGGSWDRDTVVRALRAAFNNPERAVEYLYSVMLISIHG